jgi:hypothetical protein
MVLLAFTAGCASHPVWNAARLGGGWEYRWEKPGAAPNPAMFASAGPEWKTLAEPRNPPGREKGAWVLFRTVLPANLPPLSVLIIPDMDQCFQVYLDGRLIYVNGTTNNRFSGFSLSQIFLPDSSAGKRIVFRFYSDIRNIGIYNGVLSGPPSELILELIRSDIDKLVLGLAFILLSLSGILLFFRRVPWRDYLPLVFFTFCMGIYTFGRTSIKSILFGDHPTLWGYLELLSLYAMPIGVFGFTRSLFVIRRVYHPLRLLEWFYIAWSVFAIAAAFAGKNLLMDALPVFQIAMLVSIIILTVFFFARAARGDVEARIYSSGILALVAFAVLDVVNSFYHLSGLPFLSHWGSFLFLLSLGVLFGRRIFHLYSNLQKYSAELESKNLAVSEARTDLEKLYDEIEETQKEVIFRLSEVAEARSRETGNHVRRVAAYCAIIGQSYSLPGKELEILRLAAPMHDIGKLGIPDAILNKPGKLTAEEFEKMKTHTVIGYEMLSRSRREIFSAAATVAYQHHERWNGKGYPNALSGSGIHVFGRITAVADVFDSLCSERVYKSAWPIEDVLAYFHSERGGHFDPELVDVFFRNIDTVIEMRNHYQD